MAATRTVYKARKGGASVIAQQEKARESLTLEEQGNFRRTVWRSENFTKYFSNRKIFCKYNDRDVKRAPLHFAAIGGTLMWPRY